MANQNDVESVKAVIDAALPATKPFGDYPGGTIEQALDAGNSPQYVGDGYVRAVKALGIPADPSGQFQSARKKAFSGEFNVQDALVNYFTQGAAFPSDADLRLRIFGGGSTVQNPPVPNPGPQPVPVTPFQPVPPAPAGSATGTLEERFTWLYNLVTQNHDARILKLEGKNVPTVGGPGNSPGPGIG